MTEKLTEQTKNNQGVSKQTDQIYNDGRMYETSSSLDPVSAFEFYLGKTNKECDEAFQTPRKSISNHRDFWFKNEPLGKNTISKLMERISLKATLSQ